MAALNTTLSAIENMDDYYFVESLKHPLPTRLTRTGLQLTRRKTNISELRQIMSVRNLTYSGLLLVGMMDDTLYADHCVYNTLMG